MVDRNTQRLFRRPKTVESRFARCAIRICVLLLRHCQRNAPGFHHQVPRRAPDLAFLGHRSWFASRLSYPLLYILVRRENRRQSTTSSPFERKRLQHANQEVHMHTYQRSWNSDTIDDPAIEGFTFRSSVDVAAWAQVDPLMG